MWKLGNQKMNSDKKQFFDRSDLSDKLDRLERAEGNKRNRKRAERKFDEKRV